MTTTSLENPERAATADTDLGKVVAEMVLSQLGTPKNLYRIDARSLWGNQYRINILCTIAKGHRIDDVRITDSFFVTRTADGIVCQPPIARKYE